MSTTKTVALTLAAVAVVGFGAYQLGGRTADPATVEAGPVAVWEAVEEKREEAAADRRYAQKKADDAARRERLAPTAATLETLLRDERPLGGPARQANAERMRDITSGRPAGDDVQYGPADPAYLAMDSDITWLHAEVQGREGVQAVYGACHAVYGDTMPADAHGVCVGAWTQNGGAR